MSDAGFTSAQTAPGQAQKLNVTKIAWVALTPEEQGRLRGMRDVTILEDDQYGIVIDAQGADQSTPGTNTGAVLGGAVANAGYVDNALRGGRYSAMNQLAAGVLGAALGSTMDSQATAKFQFRYAIRLGDGDVKYFDEIKGTPFRHSIGVCLLVQDLTLVSQRLCNQTGDMVRQAYLK